MTPTNAASIPSEEERRTRIALFRYGLIAAMLNRPRERGEITAHLAAIASQTHQIPFSTRTHVDAETAWRYLARYRPPHVAGYPVSARQNPGEAPRRGQGFSPLRAHMRQCPLAGGYARWSLSARRRSPGEVSPHRPLLLHR